MLELIALAGLVIAGLAVFAVVGVVFLVIRIVFWAVFLPFRLLFGLRFSCYRSASPLLWVPIGLTWAPRPRLAPRSCRFFWSSAPWSPSSAPSPPILALLVPAIPFVLLGLMIWAIVRKRPVSA